MPEVLSQIKNGHGPDCDRQGERERESIVMPYWALHLAIALMPESVVHPARFRALVEFKIVKSTGRGTNICYMGCIMFCSCFGFAYLALISLVFIYAIPEPWG